MSDSRRLINASVTNKKTGKTHYAQVKDGKIIFILCNANITSDYEIGTKNTNSRCRRCCASYTGSGRGCYDYSKTVWGHGGRY